MAALLVTEDWRKTNVDGKYRVSKKTQSTTVHSRVTKKGGNLRGNISKQHDDTEEVDGRGGRAGRWKKFGGKERKLT